MGSHFREVWREAGVDGDATHNQQAATWMMVPHMATNYVYLVDAKGLTWDKGPNGKVEIKEIRPGDPSVAKLTVAGAKPLSVSEARGHATQNSARLLALTGIRMMPF